MRETRRVPAWGDRLRRLREARGWSQGELAHRAGTTQAQISRIETSLHTNAWAETLWGLADALGVSMDYLVGREPRGADAADAADARLVEVARIVRVVLAEEDRDRRAAETGTERLATGKRDSNNLKATRAAFVAAAPPAAMVS